MVEAALRGPNSGSNGKTGAGDSRRVGAGGGVSAEFRGPDSGSIAKKGIGWFFVTFGAGCEHVSSSPTRYHV